jgi:hypothetical protein
MKRRLRSSLCSQAGPVGKLRLWVVQPRAKRVAVEPGLMLAVTRTGFTTGDACSPSRAHSTEESGGLLSLNQIEHRSNIRRRPMRFVGDHTPRMSRVFCLSASAGIRLVLLCTQGVGGSSPLVSTTSTRGLAARPPSDWGCVPSFCLLRPRSCHYEPEPGRRLRHPRY